MNRVKSIIAFVGQLSPTNQWITILLILLSIVELPAFLFHELMHLLIVIPFSNSFEIKDKTFYRVKGNFLCTYNLLIWYDSNKTIGLIGSISPLIGWIMLLIFSLLYSNWILLFYLVIGFRMFFLSKEDILSANKNGLPDKISNFLLKIREKIQTEVKL